jgi:hypothetical protein
MATPAGHRVDEVLPAPRRAAVGPQRVLVLVMYPGAAAVPRIVYLRPFAPWRKSLR